MEKPLKYMRASYSFWWTRVLSRITPGTANKASGQSKWSGPATLRAAVLFALALAVFGLPAPAADPEPPPPLTTNAIFYVSMDALDDKQLLGSGDRVSYRVIEDKEEPKSLVVSDSGELEIPYYGRIKAADKTCKAVARDIKAALEKDLYYQATVIVAIDQLNKKRGSVYLVGQIRVSGAQDIPSDEVFTLSKAILKAGGFSDFADKKRVKLTRKDPAGGENKVFLVDVSEIFEKGRTDKDIKVEAGDLIFVPSRLLNF